MGKIKFTTTEIEKALDSQINTPWHDCADSAFTSANKQAVTASTAYAFEVDKVAYEDTNFPAHITKLWDEVNNKIYLTETLDSPVYVARIQLTFEPSVAAEGYIEFNLQPDNVAPEYVNTVRVPYKASQSRVEALFTFYVKGQTKADGLVITYTPSTNGTVWDRGILIYKT